MKEKEWLKQPFRESCPHASLKTLTCASGSISPTTGGKLEPIRALPKHYGMRGGQTGSVPVGAPNHGLQATAYSLRSAPASGGA
jgi:hypothetical protein